MNTYVKDAMIAITELENKIPNITLRDYFAGQALAGMGEYLMTNRDNLQGVAESCYTVADAMLKYKQ